MSEQNIRTILDALSELKSDAKNNFGSLEGQLAIIDKRLSLIEQRLMNIERWVPVDHKDLHYQG